MKKLLLLIAVIAVSVATASAQKLIIGERSPEIKVSEWINGTPNNNKPKLIEFYHSSSKQSQDRVATLDNLAKKYSNKMSVVIMTREPKDKIFSLGLDRNHSFIIGIDDNGKTFSNYNVQFVPFCVIIDSKGRLTWFGNPTSLSESDLNEYIK